MRRDDAKDLHILIYLLTTVGLTPGGSSTVHIYTQTIHRTTQLTTLVGRLSGIRTQSGQTNWGEWGLCPVFVSYILAFALQLMMKKHRKTSIRVPVFGVSHSREWLQLFECGCDSFITALTLWWKHAIPVKKVSVTSSITFSWSAVVRFSISNKPKSNSCEVLTVQNTTGNDSIKSLPQDMTALYSCELLTWMHQSLVTYRKRPKSPTRETTTTIKASVIPVLKQIPDKWALKAQTVFK